MALCPVRPKATYYPPLCWGALLEVGIISKKPSTIYAVKPSWNNSQHCLSLFLPSFLWGTGDLRYYISFRCAIMIQYFYRLYTIQNCYNYQWLHSLCCILYPCDLFILWMVGSLYTFSFILCHFYSFSAISNISVKLKTLRCFFLSGFSKLEEILKRSQISLEMSNKFLKPNILWTT